MKKKTAKMKAKRPYWQHQRNYGPNFKGNATISARTNIENRIAQIITGKE